MKDLKRTLLIAALCLAPALAFAAAPAVETCLPEQGQEGLFSPSALMCTDRAPETAVSVLAEYAADSVDCEAQTEEADGDALSMTAARPPVCKKCPDRPWCTCTYNGRPRISCNPCCYQGYWDPYPICFD